MALDQKIDCTRKSSTSKIIKDDPFRKMILLQVAKPGFSHMTLKLKDNALENADFAKNEENANEQDEIQRNFHRFFFYIRGIIIVE